MRLRSLVLATLIAATATSANAAIMLATWTTTITSVGQPPKLLPDSRLENSELKIQIRYDTARGLITTEKEGEGVVGRLISTKELRPVLGVVMSYGGEDYNLGAEVGLELLQGSGERGGSFAQANLLHRKALSETQDITTTLNMRGFGGPGAVPYDFGKPFSLDFVGETVVHFFAEETQSEPGFDVSIVALSRSDSLGRLTVEQLEPTAPVPEPATWALMIAGFGMAGAAVRRRRTTLA